MNFSDQIDSSCSPTIELFYFGTGGPVPVTTEILDTQFPLALTGRETDLPVTFGNYFTLLTNFVVSLWPELLDLVSKEFAERSSTIHRVQIISEKHGGDYHPARINLISESDVLPLVANVALTERGFSRISREFATLSKLQEQSSRVFTPRVFFMREVKEAGVSALIFLGQWFEGYHEFHPTRTDYGAAIKLWDRDFGDSILTGAESEQVYRQCSFILTYYYDIDDFSEIFPWHHAAGDFVASRHGSNIDVKLIAVRQHATRIVAPDNSETGKLGALLIFFANLTIRIRLDRMDGIGAFTWASKNQVPAIIRGFWEALREKGPEARASNGFLTRFRELLNLMPLEALADLYAMTVDGYDPEAPDYELIMTNLTDHVWEVYSSLRDFLSES